MTITTNAFGGVAALNQANPNQLADALRSVDNSGQPKGIGLGSWIRQQSAQRQNVAASAAGANPYILSTSQGVQLPDDAKCGYLLYAYARAGTGTPGALTIDGVAPEKFSGSEPAAGHCTVSPSGDIMFNHTDAWTGVDWLYIPMKYDTFELTLTVAANVLTLPTNIYKGVAKVVSIFEVQATLGTSTGFKIIDVVGTAPAAGHAALNTAKTTVSFQATDAVTQARVKFGVTPLVDPEAFLENATNLY